MKAIKQLLRENRRILFLWLILFFLSGYIILSLYRIKMIELKPDYFLYPVSKKGRITNIPEGEEVKTEPDDPIAVPDAITSLTEQFEREDSGIILIEFNPGNPSL